MINKVTLLGRVGKKVCKPTKNGSYICRLSIATSEKYIDSKGIKNEITTWHIVNFFNKLADVVEKHVNVGELVYIEGQISNKTKEENGVIKFIHSIVGNEIKFLPNMKKDNINKVEGNNETDLLSLEEDEGIPF